MGARELDALYGEGHRPTARMHITGAGWEPGCRCSDECRWALDDSRQIFPTYEGACDRAAKNLRDNENGPTS
jgi:hypothetical protein